MTICHLCGEVFEGKMASALCLLSPCWVGHLAQGGRALLVVRP